ncbi:hypothetical protein JZU46_03670, partial [bacterium]|nr:hypothetical protein [bacterium]
MTAQQVPGLAQSIADHLMHIHPVTLPDRDGPDARKEALAAARKTSAWMRENGMAIHNAHSGALLELSLRGLKHAKVMSGDLRAAMLLYKLPSALARAVYVKSEQLDPRKQDHKNIVAYHKFAVPIVSQGGLALALLHVEEDRRGKFYYDAAITPEIKRLDGTSGASISCKEDRETCQRQAYVQHILTLLKVKPGLSEVHAFLCKAWGGTAGGAGERLAKADPYHDDDGRFARSPQVHYEKRQLHELYDFTLKHPLAAPDAMLVRLQASDLVAQLDKGPAVEASDGSIKVTGKQLSRQPGGTARGYGLVKFIWKHGERAGETAGYHVTRGDVLALPEVIRSTPTAIVSDATGHPVHWE